MNRKRVDFVKVKTVKEGSCFYNTRRIKEPKDVKPLIEEYAGNIEELDREHLFCICLNTKNEPNNISTVSIGSLNSSIVHPREVFKVAINSNAASIILCHNHPSGDIEPSREDINITNRLKECGKILGIDILDHVILGKNTTSLKERGIL